MKAMLVAVVACVALAALLPQTEATYGLDLSSPAGEGIFSCLKSAGYHFAVPRGYCSDGVVDPNVINTVKNAWAGGMAHVDVYMFPCPRCGNPKGQVSTAVSNLRNHGATFGMLWLDIEGTQYWPLGESGNRAFFEGLVQGAQAQGVVLGVYSSASQWIPIFGQYTGGAQFPIWYAHYDNQPNYNDWSPFGGWTRPAIKQYNGDVGACGLNLDQDWYPDGLSLNRTEWAQIWPNAFNFNATFEPIVFPADADAGLDEIVQELEN